MFFTTLTKLQRVLDSITFTLPVTEVANCICIGYFSTSRLMTSICSSVSCTASLFWVAHGTNADQNCKQLNKFTNETNIEMLFRLNQRKKNIHIRDYRNCLFHFHFASFLLHMVLIFKNVRQVISVQTEKIQGRNKKTRCIYFKITQLSKRKRSMFLRKSVRKYSIFDKHFDRS